MQTDVLLLLTVLLAISSGLMAGIYMAFSVVIMPPLASLGAEPGMVAMNSINRKILHTMFMPLFFGSTGMAMLMIFYGLWHWGDLLAGLMILTGLIYVIGMFAVTAAANVPLNNMLERAADTTEGLAPGRTMGIAGREAWHHYLKQWTMWNTVRAAACALTTILCMLCIMP